MEGELADLKGVGTAEEMNLDVVKKDECFGEMALIDQEPRSATIRAETDSLPLQISGGDFVAIMTNYPKIALHLCRKFCSRIRSLQGLLTVEGGKGIVV